jgi:PAS domain S-box-containing protein
MFSIDKLLSNIPHIKKKRNEWEKIKDLLAKIACMQLELQESANMFRAIFCINPVSMLVVGIDDSVIYEINSMFEEMSGYNRSEVIGRTVYDLNLYLDIDNRHRIVSKIIDKGFIRNEEVKYRVKNGEIKDCLLSSKVIIRGGKRLLLSVILDNSCKQNGNNSSGGSNEAK